VEHSDGAAVTTAPLGARFPQGLLVVHDGENTPVVLDDNGEPRSNTNFKLLRWEQLAGIIAG
jgi:3-phytase